MDSRRGPGHPRRHGADGRVWGIKLGSGGRCVDFCERNNLVGVGWSDVDTEVLRTATLDELRDHVRAKCAWYKTERERGMAAGQLHRFARVCSVGDFILYYDPPRKRVQIARVMSDLFRRPGELDAEDDIYQCRTVELVQKPIPILEFYGGLKGSLLGPRMSFWQLHDAYAVVDRLARGLPPDGVADPEIEQSFRDLRALLLRRLDVLNERDWEWLVVDFFKAQGAHVDERKVGGSHAIIDAEARFEHGEFGAEVWRVQVKHWKYPVDWPAIQKDYQHAIADGEVRFCFVSTSGFTDEARTRADEEGVRLLEAADFTRFLLTGRVRERLRVRLQLPVLD